MLFIKINFLLDLLDNLIFFVFNSPLRVIFILLYFQVYMGIEQAYYTFEIFQKK